jgi:hypothetical protein
MVDISDPDKQDPPPPVTVQEAVQYAEGLSRFLQEQPNTYAYTFDSGSQSRFMLNIVSRVHRLLVANLTASRQSRIGDFFGSVQSIAREEKEDKGLVNSI